MDIKVTICEIKQFDDGWPPENGPQCIEWLKAKVEQIPEEYRSSSSIDIDSDSFYDSIYARIKIYYYRPETEDEKKLRERQKQEREEMKRKKDLAELARLKAKYEEGILT